jgi:predicted ATPase
VERANGYLETSFLPGRSIAGPADFNAQLAAMLALPPVARDRLDESGEVDAMFAGHAAYYRQMAEDAHEGLRGATGPMWRERLTSELGNLRAALDWFIARGDADAALSLVSGMAWLWCIKQRLRRRSTLAW